MGIKRDSLYLVILRGMTLVSGAVTSILVARALGPEGKGILHLIFLLPAFVASLGGMGTRAAAVYFAGRGFSKRALAKRVFGISLALSALYVVIGLVLQTTLAATLLKGLEIRWVVLSVALIPFFLFWSFGDGMLHGMFRFGAYTAIQIGSLVIKLGLLVVLVGLLKQGLPAAVVAYGLATVIPAVATVVLVWALSSPQGEKPRLRSIVGYGVQVHWGNIAQRANLSLDVFIINPYVGAAAVGLYSISVLLAEMVWQIPNALGQVLFPRVAASKADDAAHVTCFLSRQAFGLAVVAAALLALFGGPVIRLIYGAEFAGALPALWALLPGVVALSASLVLAQYLAGIGRPVFNSIASVIAFVGTVIALFVLVPRFGILGAGMASSLAYLLHTLVVMSFCKRLTGIGFRDMLFPRREDWTVYREALRGPLGRVRRWMKGKKAA